MPPTTSPTHEEDGVTAAKAALRAQIRAARRQRRTEGTDEARHTDAEAIALGGMQWLAQRTREHGPVRCVTAYESMATEPPMDRFVAALSREGVRVLVPITLPHGRLRWRDVDPAVPSHPMGTDPDEITGPTWGQEILGEVDVAFIPALAIRRDGARLGQGGGYYDRAIPALRASTSSAEASPTPVIAMAYADEVRVEVPTHPHDMRVDAVLTPGGMVKIIPRGPATA